MDPLFVGPKLKVKRANQHIDELHNIFVKFFQADACKLNIQQDPKDGGYIVSCETKPLPCQAPLIIGDAIHNLRAALDLMVCEIVVLSGDSPDKWTSFPFRDTRDDLVNTINGGKIKAADPAIVNLILDTIKPYKGGNDTLYSLHDLDIVDKHKLLIPVAGVTALVGVDMIEPKNQIVFSNNTYVVGQGGKLGLAKTVHPMQITNPGKPSFGVFFPKGQIFENEPVVPTLKKLSQLVAGIVETIEKAYIALAESKK